LKHKIQHIIQEITQDNYLDILAKELGGHDFLANLSVDISSVDLMKYCLKNDVFYIDTCIEPWVGRYDNESLEPIERSNFALRQEALKLEERAAVNSKTAVVAHGANPGIVSHFVKAALLNLAKLNEVDLPEHLSHTDWTMLAKTLNIEVCQISEHDS